MNFPPILFYDQRYSNISTNIYPMQNSSSIISYQNLYRKLLKFENKDKNFQSSVINWLKTLTKIQLIKYFSFSNQWLVDIIHEMIIISKYNPSTKYIFKPAIRNKEEILSFFNLFEQNNISLYKPDYADYFQVCDSGYINLSAKSYPEKLQKKFIDYIRYLTIPSNTQNNNFNYNSCNNNQNYNNDKEKVNEKFFFEYNNVVTLSNEYLSNINNLIDIMQNLSNNELFKYPIEIETQYSELGRKYYYNARLSKWLNAEFTLSELLCCYFEQCILINYQYYLLYSEEIDFLYYDKLEELINNSEKLIEFIGNANEKRIEIIQSIKKEDINQFFKDNLYIRKIISEKKKKNDILIFNNCDKNDYYFNKKKQSVKEIIDSTMIVLENTFIKGDKNFITLLTYIKDNYVFKEEDFIIKVVYDKINNYWKNKMVEDLLHDDLTTNYDNNQKKRKKKKKKKKNNDKKEENNENDNKNNENNININGRSPKKDEKKENIKNNNDNNDKNSDLNEKINNEKNDKILINETETSTSIKTDNTDKENMLYNINNKIDSNNNKINSNNIINEDNKINLNDKEDSNNNIKNEIKEKEELNEEDEKEENNKKKKEKNFFLYPVQVVKNKKKKNKNKKKDKKLNSINNNDILIQKQNEVNNDNINPNKNIENDNNKKQNNNNNSNNNNDSSNNNNFNYNKNEIFDKNEKYKKQKNDFDYNSKQKNKFNMAMKYKNINKDDSSNFIQFENININNYNKAKKREQFSFQSKIEGNAELENNHNGNNGYFNPNKIESNISRSKEDNKYLLAGSNFPRFTSFYFNSKKKGKGRSHRNKNNDSDINAYSFISNNISVFSNEIIQNTIKVNKNKEILQKLREKYIKKIYENINIILFNEKIDFLCSFYGSSISGLSIENSDIDIMVKLKQNKSEINYVNKIMNILVFNLKKNNINFITNIVPIYTASVPVIKLECDLSNDEYFGNEINNIIKNCDLSYNDINKLFFDITFFEVENEQNKIPSELMIDYIKENIDLYPQIIDIVYIMKRFLFNRKLNKSYQGGISSYSLFLLTLAFIKYFKNNYDIPIGSLLIEYLNYYSNFNFYISEIKPSKDDEKEIYSINEKNSLYKYNINIIDPITGINVAKSTFKIEEIKNAFKEGLDIIIGNLYKVNNDGGNNNKNILDNFLAKIN